MLIASIWMMGFWKVYLCFLEAILCKAFVMGLSVFSVERGMGVFPIFLRNMSILQIWKHDQRSAVEEYIAGIIEDIIDDACSRNTKFQQSSNKFAIRKCKQNDDLCRCM